MTTCHHSFPDPHPAPLTHIRDCRHCGTSYQDAKTAMTAADEIEAAAKTLRTATFRGAMTATPAVAALIRAREPLALLLEGVLSSGREGGPAHEECSSWCSPETCDLSAALAVARAILGTQETT